MVDDHLKVYDTLRNPPRPGGSLSWMGEVGRKAKYQAWRDRYDPMTLLQKNTDPTLVSALRENAAWALKDFIAPALMGGMAGKLLGGLLKAPEALSARPSAIPALLKTLGWDSQLDLLEDTPTFIRKGGSVQKDIEGFDTQFAQIKKAPEIPSGGGPQPPAEMDPKMHLRTNLDLTPLQRKASEFREQLERIRQFKKMGHTQPTIQTTEDLANMATFGNKRGPLLHPERMISGPGEMNERSTLPGSIADQLRANKQIPKARKSQIDFIERIANSDLRESIMRNDNPGSFMGGENDPARMKDVFQKKTLFDFINPKGQSKQ